MENVKSNVKKSSPICVLRFDVLGNNDFQQCPHILHIRIASLTNLLVHSMM